MSARDQSAQKTVARSPRSPAKPQPKPRPPSAGRTRAAFAPAVAGGGHSGRGGRDGRGLAVEVAAAKAGRRLVQVKNP